MQYLNQIFNEWRPSGELVSLLTDPFLAIRFFDFFRGSLEQTHQENYSAKKKTCFKLLRSCLNMKHLVYLRVDWRIRLLNEALEVGFWLVEQLGSCSDPPT